MRSGGRDEIERRNLRWAEGRDGRVGCERERADVVGEWETGGDEGKGGGINGGLEDGCEGSEGQFDARVQKSRRLRQAPSIAVDLLSQVEDATL